MKRRIVLLLGTFAILLAGFMGYRLASRWASAGRDGRQEEARAESGGPRPPDPRHETPPGPEKIGQVELSSGEDLRAETWDEDQLRRVFEWDSYEKTGPHTYDLVRPRITFYLERGQEVYIRADAGTGRTEGTDAMGADFRELFLSGNVELLIDRGRTPNRPPLSERPEDRVLIRMDSVRFDQQLLQIETNSRIELESAEADISGQGLDIRWKEAPRQLELLRINKGEKITLYDVPDDMEVVALPGAARTEPAPEPAPPDRPTESEPSGGEPPPRPPAERPVAAAGGEPDDPAPKRPPDEGDNIYVVELFDEVRLVSDTGRIENADHLTLRFERDRGLDEGSESEEPEPRRRDRPERDRPAERPGPDPVKPPKPRTKPVVITWEGDLVLRPDGYTPTPSPKRYTAAGRGEGMVLTDQQTRAECDSFLFKRDADEATGAPSQRGRLVGTAEDPAVLTLDNGSRAECEEMRFDRTAGRAELLGPGSMIGKGGRVLATSKPPEGEPERDAAKDETRQRIQWTDSVLIDFTEQRARQPDGEVAVRQRIDQALFRGGVRLEQEAGAEDEFVECDTLLAEMTNRDGDIRVDQAIATGNVYGRWEGRDLWADRAVVDFDRRSPEPGAEPEWLASTLDATGNARVRDESGAEPFEATAARIVSDLVQRNAFLYADDDDEEARAVLHRGTNRLFGRTIRVYQVLDEADPERREVELRTEGVGELEFTTVVDIFGDGAERDEPREVRVTWKDGMSYFGQRDTAEFLGTVRLHSGPDFVASESLRLWFERTAEEPADPADEESGLALGMPGYSSRRVRMVRATGENAAERNVVYRRVELDEEGRLLRRMQLRSTNFNYDRKLQRASITSWGKMIAEDYRSPADKGGGSGEERFGADQRPTQTVLEWRPVEEPGGGPRCYMELLQAEREATVHGDVTMKHFSGKDVRAPEGLRTPDWGALTEGSSLSLRCGAATVWFAESAEEADAPRVGQFERFHAWRRARLTYAPYEARGERILYDRSRDLATVYGYLKDEPKADAEVIMDDPASGRSQVYSSPMIRVWPDSQRVETIGGKGSFGR